VEEDEARALSRADLPPLPEFAPSSVAEEA